MRVHLECRWHVCVSKGSSVQLHGLAPRPLARVAGYWVEADLRACLQSAEAACAQGSDEQRACSPRYEPAAMKQVTTSIRLQSITISRQQSKIFKDLLYEGHLLKWRVAGRWLIRIRGIDTDSLDIDHTRLHLLQKSADVRIKCRD